MAITPGKRIAGIAKSFLPLDPAARGLQLFWLKRIGMAAVLLLVVANLFSPTRHDELDLPQGSIASRDINAPFDFPILVPDDSLKAQQDSAASRVLAIVYRDPSLDRKIAGDIDRFLINLVNLREDDEYLAQKIKVLESWNLKLSTSTVNLLLSTPNIYAFQQGLKELCDQTQAAGILPLSDREARALGSEVMVSGTDRMDRKPVRDLISHETLPIVLRVKASSLAPASDQLARAIAEAAGCFLLPNLYVDLQEVETARLTARATVPPHLGQVRKGEKIVSANDAVDYLTARKLASLRGRLEAISLASRRGGWRYLLTLLSRLLALGFFIGILIFYLRQFRPEIFKSDSWLLLLATVILINMLCAWLVWSQPDLSPYLIPAAVGPMIISLMFDVTLGAVVAVTSSLLLGVVASLSLPVTVVALASSWVACLTVKGIRGRLQFILTSFLALAIVNILAIAAVEYLKLSPFDQIKRALTLGPANALMVVLLVLILLPMLEAVFRTTTDFSLLELADPDQPLLKRLAIEAPGTFQHSLLVGNLAEAAANATGANSLQARIMGYYHDAGKLSKPEYYIENQSKAESPHETLAPKMSCLVLYSHVKEGVGLARAHRLPKLLVDAIAQHHGTTLCKFFYHKAQRMSDGIVPESDYRYPGPKPQTREIGLVMLADAVEATVRSLKDKNPKRIRRIVQATIVDKANGLELDETNLTLHDLLLAGEAFIPILLAVFHPRIEYPSAQSGDGRTGDGRTGNGRANSDRTGG